MITVNNPFGQDPAEYNEETAASRVGGRIRRIRVEKGLSQAELGEKIGLNADRVQKYENGQRKPRADLLKKIAGALEVSTQALMDPDTTSYIGAMYAFFEMEEFFNAKIEKTPEDGPPGLCLSVEFTDGLYPYMEEWYKTYTVMQTELLAAATQEEKASVRREYHNWEWNFPGAITDRASKEMQKARLKTKIDELQEAYNRLENESI